MNEKTVPKCIEELEQKKFIIRVSKGVSHSHVNKPKWRIPLSEFQLDQGGWIPVPRFIIKRYLRDFHNAVLLLFILYYQHMSWKNKAWVGVTTLCKRTGWSPTRVRKALRTMGHEHIWNKQNTNLPWPLEILYAGKPGEERRRFRVRAVWYKRMKKKGGGVSTIQVSEEFRKRFKIQFAVGYEKGGK